MKLTQLKRYAVTAALALTALASVGQAQAEQRAICYNCPPEWADWGSQLKAINARLNIAVPPDNKNSGQSIAALITDLQQRGLLAPGVKFNQLFGHFLRGLAHARFGFGPCVAAQLGQLYALAVARRGITADNVQLRHGHIQAVALVVFDF